MKWYCICFFISCKHGHAEFHIQFIWCSEFSVLIVLNFQKLIIFYCMPLGFLAHLKKNWFLTQRSWIGLFFKKSCINHPQKTKHFAYIHLVLLFNEKQSPLLRARSLKLMYLYCYSTLFIPSSNYVPSCCEYCRKYRFFILRSLVEDIIFVSNETIRVEIIEDLIIINILPTKWKNEHNFYRFMKCIAC